jgi:hypothetical protein
MWLQFAIDSGFVIRRMATINSIPRDRDHRVRCRDEDRSNACVSYHPCRDKGKGKERKGKERKGQSVWLAMAVVASASVVRWRLSSNQIKKCATASGYDAAPNWRSRVDKQAAVSDRLHCAVIEFVHHFLFELTKRIHRRGWG